MINLGDRVKDTLTGFSGIVVAKTDWLNVCARMGVPDNKKNTIKTNAITVIFFIGLSYVKLVVGQN